MARRLLLVARCMISVASLLLICPTFAQQPQGASSGSPKASIAGRITVVSGEGATNSLPGVNVKLTGPSVGGVPQSTVTDADGHYEFTEVAAGTYTLEVSADGFKTWSGTITLGATRSLVKDIVLQISSVNQQVEVQGEAAEIATQNVAITATVNTEQLESLPLPTQKFTEALSLIPGVVRTYEGSLRDLGLQAARFYPRVPGKERPSRGTCQLDSAISLEQGEFHGRGYLRIAETARARVVVSRQ